MYDIRQGTILKSAVPAKEDLQKINRYTRRELEEKELYCFNVILCDNEIDRDGEAFSVPALHKLAELFLGKTGIFNHDPKGENQTARIYDTKVCVKEGTATQNGEPYTYLLARAYMVRSEKTADLILEIDAGIKKEVSVGCSVDSVTCSICGTDLRGRSCEHQKGEIYNHRVCCAVLSEPTDAYEWSFVAVPAQKNAGVTKRYGAFRTEEQPQEAENTVCREPEEVLKLLKLTEKELVLNRLEAQKLTGYVNRLKQEAKLGKEFRRRRQEQVKGVFLLQYPQLGVGTIQAVVEKMSDQELSEFEAVCKNPGGTPQLQSAAGTECFFQKDFKI